jgi:predicted Mrr-cat superfamily restriction endonuclease
MASQAFILHMTVSTGDKVPEALASEQTIIGWAEARGLIDPALDWSKFREIVKKTYYNDDPDYRGAGGAGGSLWRFTHDMQTGDLVVVPHGNEFYVAEIAGDATYDESKIGDDSAYRRPVKWLNGARPISRVTALSALQSRMKAYQTCVNASDLVEEIRG